MNSIHSLKDVWNKYNFILSSAQKRWGIVVILMTLVGAVFETLGVSVILPLIQGIMSPETLWGNKYFSRMSLILHVVTREQMIYVVGIGVVLVYVAKNLFLFLLSYVRAKYACKVQRELSAEMMRSYLGREYNFFLNVNTSEILRGMTSNIIGTYEALYQIFKILAELFTVAFICIYILIMDLWMALCIICLAGICLFIVFYGFRKWMKRCGEREYELNNALNKTLLQAFQGVKEVLVMNKQDYFSADYEKKYILRQNPVIGKAIASESPSYLIEAVCVIGLIFTVCVKAIGITDTTIFVSQLAAVAVGAFRILPSLGRISSSFNLVTFYMPALSDTYRNIFEIRKQEYKERQMPQNDNIEKFCNKIEIKDVTWNYDGTEKKVLDKVSLTINKGQSVAFIGRSGAGKTTLADIILGLLHPQEGKVIIDGKFDIKDIPVSWSHIINFVPQSVYLIDDTIRNNIAFGVKEEEIRDDQIWNALEQAQMKDFVKNLAKGLNTIIGERGIKFSGGQRQRIAIARALYNNPDILVLDEATSALDNDTESAVMEAIEQLQGRKTLIIIAHRLTTVKKCDIIYEIKDGRVTIVDKEILYALE